jgi:hypothetical protein
MDVDVTKLRARLHHYLSPEVARYAGISVQELQTFVSGECAVLGGGGCVELSDAQLLALARRAGCCDE